MHILNWPRSGGRRVRSAGGVAGPARRGFFKLAEPLVVRLTRRQSQNAAENLKALLEEDAL